MKLVFKFEKIYRIETDVDMWGSGYVRVSQLPAY